MAESAKSQFLMRILASSCFVLLAFPSGRKEGKGREVEVAGGGGGQLSRVSSYKDTNSMGPGPHPYGMPHLILISSSEAHLQIQTH